MNFEKNLFYSSLQNNDKTIFNKVNKGELHTHALLGSSREIFYKFFPNTHLSKFIYKNGIYSLSTFIKNNIIHISTTKLGQLQLFECTIISAIKDGISLIETSVDYRLVLEVYNNNIYEYADDLKQIKKKYKDKIEIKFDLGISRNAYKKEHQQLIVNLLKTKVFEGLDLFGDESSKKISTFKKIYKFAKKNNIKRKAHVGEFGSARDVYIAIKTLNLNVVQHGIAIIDDLKALKYAKKKNVQFNICPISNLKLKRISSIKNHPIRKMFDFGLNITINTDDQLIFENSLFDEYYLLYKNKVFSLDELNIIRLNSIKKLVI